MKEKLKNVLAIALGLLVISIWLTIGFKLPEKWLMIEQCGGLGLIILIYLVNRK